MNNKINIGMIQMSSQIGCLEQNMEVALEKVKIASEQGADILCFPELFIEGYDMDQKDLYSTDKTLKYSEYIVESLAEAAKEYNVYIVAPTALAMGKKVYNSALFFNKNGKVLGEYNKVHLFEKERDVFDSGENFVVWDTTIGKIGIIICYDAGFPEASRELALNGAEIIFCPSAWRIQDKLVWDLNLAQRAYENTVFFVGVNSVTKTDKLHLFGSSKVIAPNGEVLAQANEDEEEIVICEINLDDISKHRKMYTYLRDRRPETYKTVTK